MELQLKSLVITGNIEVLYSTLETYRGGLDFVANGQTLLEMIIGTNHKEKYEMMHMVLNKGADINQQNAKGMTPIMHAIITNDLEIIRICLNYHANLSLKDHSFYTPLMYAVTNYHLNQCEIVKLLLDAGADVNQIGLLDATALHYAVISMNRRSSLEIVRLLINRGANIYYVTNNHYNILMAAINSMDAYDIVSQPFRLDVPFRKSEDTMDLIIDLLKNGFDINQSTIYGTTPLILAVKLYLDTYALPLVKLLLDHGADVNRVDHDGNTALIWAARNLKTEIPVLELLINYGANIDAFTYSEMNFLDYLSSSHFKSCQKYVNQIHRCKELHIKLCQEITSQVPHILYRPDSIRVQLLALKWNMDSNCYKSLKIKNAFLISYLGISDDNILCLKIVDQLGHMD